MKNWNALRVIGVMGALMLIVFGSLDNFLRTVKLGVSRLNRRDE